MTKFTDGEEVLVKSGHVYCALILLSRFICSPILFRSIFISVIFFYRSPSSSLKLIYIFSPFSQKYSFFFIFPGGLSELHPHHGGAVAGSALRLWHELVSSHVPHVCHQRQQLHAGDLQKRSGRLSLRSASQLHLCAGG